MFCLKKVFHSIKDPRLMNVLVEARLSNGQTASELPTLLMSELMNKFTLPSQLKTALGNGFLKMARKGQPSLMSAHGYMLLSVECQRKLSEGPLEIHM